MMVCAARVRMESKCEHGHFHVRDGNLFTRGISRVYDVTKNQPVHGDEFQAENLWPSCPHGSPVAPDAEQRLPCRLREGYCYHALCNHRWEVGSNAGGPSLAGSITLRDVSGPVSPKDRRHRI